MNLSNSASPEKLIKRVAFDLTGLPPSKDEIENLLRTILLKLMKKWLIVFIQKFIRGTHASHWLDIARYSDKLWLSG